MSVDRRTDSLVGQACVEAAIAVAQAIVVGIDHCQCNGRPLSQLQQVDMLQAALMEYDGHRARLEKSFTFMNRLTDLSDIVGGGEAA